MPSCCSSGWGYGSESRSGDPTRTSFPSGSVNLISATDLQTGQRLLRDPAFIVNHPLMITAWGRKRGAGLGGWHDQEKEFPLTQRRAQVHQNVAVHGQRGNGPVRGDR